MRVAVFAFGEADGEAVDRADLWANGWAQRSRHGVFLPCCTIVGPTRAHHSSKEQLTKRLFLATNARQLEDPMQRFVCLAAVAAFAIPTSGQGQAAPSWAMM